MNRLMKKIVFLFAVLFSVAACTQNKPTQATENITETVAQPEDTANDLAVKEEFLNRNSPFLLICRTGEKG